MVTILIIIYLFIGFLSLWIVSVVFEEFFIDFGHKNNEEIERLQQQIDKTKDLELKKALEKRLEEKEYFDNLKL